MGTCSRWDQSPTFPISRTFTNNADLEPGGFQGIPRTPTTVCSLSAIREISPSAGCQDRKNELELLPSGHQKLWLKTPHPLLNYFITHSWTMVVPLVTSNVVCYYLKKECWLQFFSNCVFFYLCIDLKIVFRKVICVFTHPSLNARCTLLPPKIFFPMTAIKHIFCPFFCHALDPILWCTTCICFFQRSSLTGPTALPGSPSPPVAEDFHMRAVMAWRMHTVRRACRAQHGAWLGKMEGEPANHATRLVATLTRTCQSVQHWREVVALVLLHTFAV